MRKVHLLTVLYLFLLVPASITRAQTVTQQKGLTTAVFSLPQGKIRIYLPGDIRAGDLISGTVSAEPEGNNERQVAKNLEQILKSSIRFNNEIITLNQPSKVFQTRFAKDQIPNGIMELTGSNSGRLTIPVKETSTPRPALLQCLVPTHALTDAPVQITGPFDGNATNTNCTWGNTNLLVLAESPSQCILQFPTTAEGSSSLKIEEGGRPACEQPLMAVNLDVSAGKLNLMKGEKTWVEVKITGLQTMRDPATLSLVNQSTSIVSLFPSNNIIIPLPPDSVGSGNFQKRFDVTSNRTGSFAIQVNLDLPQPQQQNAPETDQPTNPTGYVTRKCKCENVAKIELVNSSGNNKSYKANVTAKCSEACGTGINTFTACKTLSVKYAWSISGNTQAAEIVGPSNGQTVTVTEKNKDGNYKIVLTSTTLCDCEGSCSSTDAVDHPGTTVDNPADPSHPPTQPIDPDHPGTVTRYRCDCHVKAFIIPTGMDDDTMYFSAGANAACKGFYGVEGNLKKCQVVKKEYAWSVIAGGDVGAINGPANGPNVKITTSKPGTFTLQLTVTITCSDGSVCSDTVTLTVEVPGDIACRLNWREDVASKMDGGLAEWSTNSGKKNKTMNRDDFIALSARGSDYDRLVWTCRPNDKCKDKTGSAKSLSLNGRVKFEWYIESGPGSFVKLGCLPDNGWEAEGDNVIFKPAAIPLPVLAKDTTVTTEIMLSIIDDNSTQPQDETVLRKIIITVTRKTASPDQYFVTVTGPEGKDASVPELNSAAGICETKNDPWDLKTNLHKPILKLPGIAQEEIILPGQWIIIEADKQDDLDRLRIWCKSPNECPSSPAVKNYIDNVKWNWSITTAATDKGKFIGIVGGRFVIYEAPKKLFEKDEKPVEVFIKASIINPGGKATDTYAGEQSGQVKLTIYKAGVKMHEVTKEWVPEKENQLRLKSELMYKDGQWKPGPAHSCRIHFFELMNVGQERGACMNDIYLEEGKSEACYDLDLKKTDSIETYEEKKIEPKTIKDPIDDKKKTIYCDRKEMFFKARSIQPARESFITINSYDYGAFGFIRSFANIPTFVNQKFTPDLPVYFPIIWTDKTVTHAHPTYRYKKTPDYDDNRVTIPLDIDENHIADGGYMSAGVKIIDPLNGKDEFKSDDDPLPTGDGFNGDGLSNYEEYRGFMTLHSNLVQMKTEFRHLRTDHNRKDIFIMNLNNLDLSSYTSISGLNVHEVSPAQYGSDATRYVNFNFTEKTHTVHQRGLLLTNPGWHDKLLGVAVSAFGSLTNFNDPNHRPVPPNWEVEIRVYQDKIHAVCSLRKFLDKFPEKMRMVTAHELLHGNNVCHHGEKLSNPEEGSTTMNNPHGLRSGDVTCVMRYDNVGKTIDENCNGVDEKDAKPEDIGSRLCISPVGTGYNKPKREWKEKKGGVEVTMYEQSCFGNADTHRGNCAGQIRVSGKGYDKNEPTKNGTPPKNCGNRFD